MAPYESLRCFCSSTSPTMHLVCTPPRSPRSCFSFAECRVGPGQASSLFPACRLSRRASKPGKHRFDNINPVLSPILRFCVVPRRHRHLRSDGHLVESRAREIGIRYSCGPSGRNVLLGWCSRQLESNVTGISLGLLGAGLLRVADEQCVRSHHKHWDVYALSVGRVGVQSVCHLGSVRRATRVIHSPYCAAK